MPSSSAKLISKPGVVFLSQIIISEVPSEISSKDLKKVSSSLLEWGFNLTLPLLCLSEDEDKYHLLSGYSIYEAALASEVKQIWAILLAVQKEEALKAVEQLALQSKLNLSVIDSDAIDSFLNFINDKTSALTSISGIGEGYAKKIVDNGPYKTIAELQAKLGSKRPLSWIRAYQQMLFLNT